MRGWRASSGELGDALLVLALDAELVAREEPLGALPCAAGLDVGGLLAGLPAAGDDDGALDGRALLAVDVLGVGEAQALEVLASEVDSRSEPSSLTVSAVFAGCG